MNLTPKQLLVQNALLSALRQQHNPRLMKQMPAGDANAQRKFLGDILIASNTNWKKDTLNLIDQLYQSEQLESVETRKHTSMQDILRSNNSTVVNYKNTTLAVWKGDITKLSTDAIVNAANEQGLGCFVPHHKCIDNVIHRAAGPRLRLACKQAMMEREEPLLARSPPIVTEGFFLPTKYVIHVTGPQIAPGHMVSKQDESDLINAYRLSLDAAVAKGAKSIAFPCISTGLFGYPQEQATEVALATVRQWLDEHPGALEAVVFDVFTEKDEQLYETGLETSFVKTVSPNNTNPPELSMTDNMNQLAKTWIEEADAVLICAGAGMSVKEGEMVYTNPQDFAKHYPYFTQWGYHAAYEAMGLFGDRRVPPTAKWAFWAKHLHNMRWAFSPNQGYDYLRQFVGDKDHFVMTSNVDGCFERAGFDPNKIYTPQGDYGYLQCMRACQSDSVFDARPYLEKLIPNISEDGYVPEQMIPHCPRCGGDMFGNVRGGSWFLHDKYKEGNKAAINWMKGQVGKKVVAIEVGAGFNTPMVTRWPVESFVRETSGKLIRINPSDPKIPSDLEGLSYAEGWQVLGGILESPTNNDKTDMAIQVREYQGSQSRLMPPAQTKKVSGYMGHFDWRLFLKSLRR